MIRCITSGYHNLTITDGAGNAYHFGDIADGDIIIKSAGVEIGRGWRGATDHLGRGGNARDRRKHRRAVHNHSAPFGAMVCSICNPDDG